MAQQPSAEQQKVVDVMDTFFAAAHDDDLTKFHSVTAPGFYIYDNGARFNGDSIMNLIKGLHAMGKHYEWSVTEPDVHIMNGNVAWIAYVNKGTITSASTTMNQQWLESAFFEKIAGRWRIMFIHSTRVPAPPPAASK
ncbi:nuclear transport factor 2 family protein [Silvibacterium bohemicum]|nr:nuclear transport factor 2 family protein [Silvibacterium bohemicum]